MIQNRTALGGYCSNRSHTSHLLALGKGTKLAFNSSKNDGKRFRIGNNYVSLNRLICCLSSESCLASPARKIVITDYAGAGIPFSIMQLSCFSAIAHRPHGGMIGRTKSKGQSRGFLVFPVNLD